MPANSIIIGVDLSPIKAIPKVITFQSDITTEKCRATLRGHLKTWKADCVLHDGAPNVGTAWVQDSFNQAALVLHSLKLATEFLIEGGTFVVCVPWFWEAGSWSMAITNLPRSIDQGFQIQRLQPVAVGFQAAIRESRCHETSVV
jgi:FtsJ-like methyltransferase